MMDGSFIWAKRRRSIFQILSFSQTWNDDKLIAVQRTSLGLLFLGYVRLFFWKTGFFGKAAEGVE